MGSEPQFGVIAPGRSYRERPTAFGLAVRDGLIALARIAKPGEAAYFDLPGGALDAGETAGEAMVREFGEETGLKVAAGDELCRAAQYLVRSDGEAVNNRAVFYAAIIEAAEEALKTEADHHLVWCAPAEALARLRHDSHAWAVACWLRKSQAG